MNLLSMGTSWSICYNHHFQNILWMELTTRIKVWRKDFSWERSSKRKPVLSNINVENQTKPRIYLFICGRIGTKTISPVSQFPTFQCYYYVRSNLKSVILSKWILPSTFSMFPVTLWLHNLKSTWSPKSAIQPRIVLILALLRFLFSSINAK